MNLFRTIRASPPNYRRAFFCAPIGVLLQNTMKKGKILFGRLNNKVRRNSADKATASHPLGGEKALPHNASRPKSLCVLCVLCGLNICVYSWLPSLWLKKYIPLSFQNSSCLGVFVAETRSIKIERLCKTNPIPEKPK